VIRDISIPLRDGTPEWPGDTPYSCRWTWRIANGDSVNVSSLTASPHVGTHADAPIHVRDGTPAAHELPLDAFFGRAVVVDVSHRDEAIDQIDFANADLSSGRVLLKTGRSIATGRFPESWPALSESCARFLVAQGVRLLGVDAPSVDARESRALNVHHILFDGGAYNLENLDLRHIEPGSYDLIAFPLNIVGADAAPVRAVLRELAR
jgi:arylformamidase